MLDDYYHSTEWGAARRRAIRRTYGLDILAWYEHGELVTGFTVHHIVPLETGWELRSDPDNLIYLTEADHREIHKRYLTDYERTAEYLRSLLVRFDNEFKNSLTDSTHGGREPPAGGRGGMRKTFFRADLVPQPSFPYAKF